VLHLSNIQRTFNEQMIKRNEKCLYCEKDLNAKSTLKKFCGDKCRIYYARQIEYETRNKKIVKEALKVEPNIDVLAKVTVAKNKVEVKKVLSEQPKKWSLAEQLAQIENEEKLNSKK